MLTGVIVALVVVGLIVFFATRDGKALNEKPSHFRSPIAPGQYRVVGLDELPGGGEVSDVVGDYASLDEAVKEAASARQFSELKVGSKGQPTKFLIFNHEEKFICDWKGLKAA